jgi:hypothetical protein
VNEFIEDHGLTIIAAIVALGVLGSQVPKMMAKQATDAQKQAVAATATAKTDLLATEALKRSERAKVADARYQAGCEVITTLKSTKVAATMTEGAPIIQGQLALDYQRAAKVKGATPLSLAAHYWNVEQVFCDFYGVTAVTRFDPAQGFWVASDIASTTNEQAINLARAKHPEIIRLAVVKGK